jgi:hypothetical protein
MKLCKSEVIASRPESKTPYEGKRRQASRQAAAVIARKKARLSTGFLTLPRRATRKVRVQAQSPFFVQGQIQSLPEVDLSS